MIKAYYGIIGAGIVGMALARELKRRDPEADILILEKEEEEALHASGRNSGVLHAGFYYTADSLKARFTVEGNRALKAYCRQKGIPVNQCGKLVVAQDEEELTALLELERRGRRNGACVRLLEEAEARELEPNIRTYRKALYAPETASVDPRRVCRVLREDLLAQGVRFIFGARYLGRTGRIVHTSQGDLQAVKIINAAGLYADQIAWDFGFGREYTLIPFKGIYLKYTKNKTDIRMNIYPVPNLRNPFLGVHFTKTADGSIKIGPTAIPAFWRENYEGLANFSLKETGQVLFYEARLFMRDAFGFRRLAFEEMRKYRKACFIQLAARMVRSIDEEGFTDYSPPGIRAQLLHKKTLRLVQDFVVEADGDSVHILNAVSPAFTCAFPFARWVVEHYMSSA